MSEEKGKNWCHVLESLESYTDALYIMYCTVSCLINAEEYLSGAKRTSAETLELFVKTSLIKICVSSPLFFVYIMCLLLSSLGSKINGIN